MSDLYKCLPRTLEINACEELSELIQAISKIYRYGSNYNTKTNLTEEIADVFVMLDMIQNKYDIKDSEIVSNVRFKQERLKQRIKEDLEKTGGSL